MGQLFTYPIILWHSIDFVRPVSLLKHSRDTRLVLDLCCAYHDYKLHTYSIMECSFQTFFCVYLQLGGKYVLWSHVTALADERVPGSITKLHNLTKDHLKLTPYGRMKVKYAVQVRL